MGFFGGKDFYSYALNRPVGMADPTGLSSQDVQRISDACHLCVQNMVQQGDRRPGSSGWNGFLNDQNSTYSTYGSWHARYLGCKDQAERCLGGLNNANALMPFDATWGFSTVLWWGGSHTVVVGRSSDPNDPLVYCDPWRDYVWTAPVEPWYWPFLFPVGPSY